MRLFLIIINDTTRLALLLTSILPSTLLYKVIRDRARVGGKMLTASKSLLEKQYTIASQKRR